MLRTTKRPVLAAILCALAQFLLTIAILKAGMAFAPPEAFGKVKLIAFASTVIVPAALVQWAGLWREVGFDLAKVRPAPIFLFALLTSVPFVAVGLHAPASGVAQESLMQLVNAFGEELLFRGLIFVLLMRLPLWQAIALNGVLFGSMHLIHGVMDGDWPAAMEQALVTSVAGTMFAAVRYRTGSLWLTILLHMWLNLAMIASNVQTGFSPTVSFAFERWANLVEVAVVALVLWQVRKTRGGLATAAA